MALDYAAFSKLARELIADAGRSIVCDILDATPADADKPWKGPAAPTVASSATTLAVFVPPGGAGLGKEISDDMLLHRAEQICLIAPAEPAFDFAAAHRVTDADGTSWRVVKGSVLAPGPLPVLYVLGVAR